MHKYASNPENFWPQIKEKIDSFNYTIENIKRSGGLIWVDSVKFVSDIPGKNNGKNGLGGGGVSTTTLMNLVKNAKVSVDIQTPYLITTSLGQQLFKRAIDRGVKIRILTNSLASTDNLEAFSSYQKNRKKLLEIGVQIYEFRPDAAERYKIMTGALQKKLNFKPIFGLHAKSMVVDGEITAIGTFNLDPRSANLNTECFAIINSTIIASNVLKGMNEEYKSENSWKPTLHQNFDYKVDIKKRVSTWTRKVLPKDIL